MKVLEEVNILFTVVYIKVFGILVFVIVTLYITSYNVKHSKKITTTSLINVTYNYLTNGKHQIKERDLMIKHFTFSVMKIMKTPKTNNNDHIIRI